MRAARTLPVLTAVLLVTAGCSASSDSVTDRSNHDAAATPQPLQAATSPNGNSSDSRCLRGTWTLDSAGFAEYMRKWQDAKNGEEPASDKETSAGVGGQLKVTYDGTFMKTNYDHLQVRINSIVIGKPAVSDWTLNGSTTFDYTATGTELTTTDTGKAKMIVMYALTVGGRKWSASKLESTGIFGEGQSGNSFAYSCTSNALKLNMGWDLTLILHRTSPIAPPSSGR
jgi:hypothetical protein